MTESDPAAVSQSWENYWQSAASRPAYAGNDTGQPQLIAFWDSFFGSVQDRNSGQKLIDIASGNGAVVERIFRAFTESISEVTCVDISASALLSLQQRFPGVRTLQANANKMPLESASVDIVTSQFGIEYAGLSAFAEVRRILRGGGEVAFLLHCQNGVIADECRRSRDAVEQMRSAQFIPRCIDMFSAGFEMLQSGDKTAYESAGRALAPAIGAMDRIIAGYGQDTANGTLLRLYRDVRDVHSRMQHHEPQEVLQWLNRMETEMDAYASRMSFMLDAALTEEEFTRLRDDFRSDGYSESISGRLVEPGKTAPLAWQYVAKKTG